MPVGHKSFAVAAAGAALLAAVAVAQPAAAASHPDNDFHASFYTGAGQTGTETPIDIDLVGQCLNLAQPARSAVNIAPVDVEVYFNPDCQQGLPGRTGDTFFMLGSLHWANFPYDAVSYRLRPMGS
ncbi:MAG: hypothetical protein ABW215_12600 [Kibdelosporangium sp.]